LVFPTLRRSIFFMNKFFSQRQLTPYEADYAQWCVEQGALLREGRLSALDRENLAEEIESLGRSDKREIENRLKVLLLHLLKWAFQPHQRKPGWRSSIQEQRQRLARVIKESPSLTNYPAQELDQEYSFARAEAAAETGLPETHFPPSCPFTIEQVLDTDFLPEPPQT
jgi:hypothetical protein